MRVIETLFEWLFKRTFISTLIDNRAVQATLWNKNTEEQMIGFARPIKTSR